MKNLKNRKLSSKQRIELIQKGNRVFNEGKISLAERIFKTAKYQDGLIRVGQYYYNKKEYLRAAEIFRIASYIKGEYACYAKLGLYKTSLNFDSEEERKKIDEQINRNLAKAVSFMLAKD